MPVTKDVAGELTAGAQQHVGRAPALGQDEVSLFPGAGKTDGDPVQVEPFARPVTDDQQTVLAQMAQQLVLAQVGITDDIVLLQFFAQDRILFHVIHGGRIEEKAVFDGKNDTMLHAQQLAHHSKIEDHTPVGVAQIQDGPRPGGQLIQIPFQLHGLPLRAVELLFQKDPVGNGGLQLQRIGGKEQVSNQAAGIQAGPGRFERIRQRCLRHAFEGGTHALRAQDLALQDIERMPALPPGITIAQPLGQYDVGHALDEPRRQERVLGNGTAEAVTAEQQQRTPLHPVRHEGTHEAHEDAPGAVVLLLQPSGHGRLAQQGEHGVRTGQVHAAGTAGHHEPQLFRTDNDVRVEIMDKVVVDEQIVQPCVEAGIFSQPDISHTTRRVSLHAGLTCVWRPMPYPSRNHASADVRKTASPCPQSRRRLPAPSLPPGRPLGAAGPPGRPP